MRSDYYALEILSRPRSRSMGTKNEEYEISIIPQEPVVRFRRPSDLEGKGYQNGWFIGTGPPAVQTVKRIGVTDAHSLFWNGQWYHSGKVQQRNQILGKWTSPGLSSFLDVIGEIHVSFGGLREPSGGSLPDDSSDLSTRSGRPERTNLD